MAAPHEEAKVGMSGRDFVGHVTVRNIPGRSEFFSCLRRSPSLCPLDARRPPGRALSFPNILSTLPQPPPPPLLRHALTRPMTRHQGDRLPRSPVSDVDDPPHPPPHLHLHLPRYSARGWSLHARLGRHVCERRSLRDVASPRCTRALVSRVRGRPRVYHYVRRGRDCMHPLTTTCVRERTGRGGHRESGGSGRSGAAAGEREEMQQRAVRRQVCSALKCAY
ncbi:uncharacterized protein SCHCODRAFT_02604118 [Schizophyllum commune H4-8]|uniref:uncharacterized protein n=1 Tax=Schizophyllum commune (strain H4-8 / FGSC 9210) TaxID=578458 RepID=UPI00215F3CFB|nr:uncharacterized protein SCHCODRAFT_02604118 [Schizophyllum commune H4-8]KAI5899080.1 hypothetical protein SCHCODRAFT_02604118 [Schizophyllum commune H4-8]